MPRPWCWAREGRASSCRANWPPGADAGSGHRMIADLLLWIEGHPGTAAWVQAGGAITALYIAIWIPRRQQRLTTRAEQHSLRQALHNQVGMVALVCLREFDSRHNAGANVDPRTARLPPLTIFDANAGKLGLLTNDEIVPLIAFSGTLHDLSVVVGSITKEGEWGDGGARENIQVLLSNACGYAATFLATPPGICGRTDKLRQQLIAELRERHQRMNPIRAKRTSGPTPPASRS